MLITSDLIDVDLLNPGVNLFEIALGLNALGLDPLAKECPDDVPCRVAEQDLWFADTPADLEAAKDLCLGCPARRVCLAGAIERREPWGVWGGELFERGAIVARKRPRGRPRKDDRVGNRPVVAA